MAKDNTITGIDVGSTKTTVCVGTHKEGIIDIIGMASKPNNGTRRGVVTDLEETVSSITAALDDAERMSGVPITSAFVSITGTHIQMQESKGIIAVSKSDGEISEVDVERVIEAARSVAMPPNVEILHVLPQYFTIDGQDEKIKDPVGMSGVRLEVVTQVIGGSISAVRNLTKCFAQAGIEIQDLIFSPLAIADIILTKKQKEAGVVLLNIGATITEMLVFEEGNLLHAKVFPIGSNHITNDIAIGLRTNIDAAERIKLEYATASIQKIKENDEIKLSSFDPSADNKISKKYIAEIVEARLIELFTMVKDELKTIHRDGMLPAGVVITGGGSQLNGINEFIKEFLRLPVQIGSPNIEVSGMVDKIDDPGYTTGIGLMFQGIHADNAVPDKGMSFTPKVDKLFDKAKDIFKNLMP